MGQIEFEDTIKVAQFSSDGRILYLVTHDIIEAWEIDTHQVVKTILKDSEINEFSIISSFIDKISIINRLNVKQ